MQAVFIPGLPWGTCFWIQGHVPPRAPTTSNLVLLIYCGKGVNKWDRAEWEIEHKVPQQTEFQALTLFYCSVGNLAMIEKQS